MIRCKHPAQSKRPSHNGRWRSLVQRDERKFGWRLERGVKEEDSQKILEGIVRSGGQGSKQLYDWRQRDLREPVLYY